MNDKEINNLKYIIKDIIQGDESATKRTEFSEANKLVLKKGLNLLLNNPNLLQADKLNLIENNWKLIYERKPPTIEEFLSEKWLGDTANYLFPYVRKILIDFWSDSPDNQYRHLILSSFIGFGKSFITILCNLYIEAHVSCLRDPKKYFNLPPASLLCLILISFTEDKAKELYLVPFMNIIESSPKFIRCRTTESMRSKQLDNLDSLCFTTAGTSAIQFEKGIDIKIGSDPRKLLGLSILSGSISELSFWNEFGHSDEKIWRLFYDLKTRIKTRFASHYFARSIVDSSPNSLETKVDKYIWNNADKDPQNLVVRGAMWEYKTWEFEDLENRFKIYKGSANRPPKVLGETEYEIYDDDDIISVPYFMKDGTDLKEVFSRDLHKSLKDLAGIPSGLADKLITNYEYLEKMFDNKLSNMYTHIFAPADKLPDKLIWNQIVDDFFIKIGNNNYEFYRSPKEIRYLAVDQSEKKDLTGISMVHLEIDIKGQLVCIVDFTITIIPTKTKINLEAIKSFIVDLYKLGKIKFGGIYFDQFQSSSTIQALERLSLPVKKSSVDISKDPYYALISWIQNERIKCGKNLYLKNNLKSLKEVELKNNKTKIDHTNGTVPTTGDDDWFNSNIGKNAKDTSDSVCSAFFNCINEYKGIPKYQYIEDFNSRNNKENIKKLVDEQYSFIIPEK